MLIECLVGGAITYFGIKKYRPPAKKPLVTLLQGNRLISQAPTQSSALSLWNEFETIEQANHHLALMSGAMGLAIQPISFG